MILIEGRSQVLIKTPQQMQISNKNQIQSFTFLNLQFQSLAACYPFSQWYVVLTAFYSHTFWFQLLPRSLIESIKV